MADPDPTICVLLPYGYDVERWRERHERGEVLDASPYGYGLAADRFSLLWSRDRAHSRPGNLLRIAMLKLLGMDLLHVWSNRRRIRAAEVVWTHTEEEYLAVVVLGRALGRPKLLAQTVWLWDRWPRLGRVRRAALRRLVARVDLELVLSSLNREVGAREVRGRRIARVPFGTSIGQVSDGPPRRMVFAPGNDRHRDWATLLDAAELVPDVDVVIASSSSSFRRIVAQRSTMPANVRVQPRMHEQQLADAYRDAAAVVIPLHENVHASGVTVAIEALGRGCLVVATDVGGLGEYLDGAEGALVPPADAKALAEAIRSLVDEPRRSASNRDLPASLGLTQLDYVRRFELATAAVLGRPWNPALEQFRPVPESPRLAAHQV